MSKTMGMAILFEVNGEIVATEPQWFKHVYQDEKGCIRSDQPVIFESPGRGVVRGFRYYFGQFILGEVEHLLPIPLSGGGMITLTNAYFDPNLKRIKPHAMGQAGGAQGGASTATAGAAGGNQTRQGPR